ncbi:hypothetical protein SK128_020922 [Halocaridina rubra]|uniref:Uncharacterized protein n=1 Tax=Halocaridina rubra TaxID=373956 RepID=A0AAN8XJL0_HALRR
MSPCQVILHQTSVRERTVMKYHICLENHEENDNISQYQKLDIVSKAGLPVFISSQKKKSKRGQKPGRPTYPWHWKNSQMVLSRGFHSAKDGRAIKAAMKTQQQPQMKFKCSPR